MSVASDSGKEKKKASLKAIKDAAENCCASCLDGGFPFLWDRIGKG